jgi:DNA ligase-associated metallophosphoesterase
MQIVFFGEQLLLLPQKALFWPAKKALILADVHFGKASHFRKQGISVPAEVEKENFHVLQELILAHEPKLLIFLGDLFHSAHNDSWNDFEQFTKAFPGIEMHLVMGNHDVLPENLYHNAGLYVHKEYLYLEPFYFTHDYNEKLFHQGVQIHGHVHPGATLKGAGRQKKTLPCFCEFPNRLILPAFGAFTGLFPMQTLPEVNIYVVVANMVWQAAKKEKKTKA